MSVAAAVLLVSGCSDGGRDHTAEPTTTAVTTTTAITAVAPPPFGQDPDPVVIGHRGAAGHHPDNSLEGFAAARDLGATWVELDVRLSADGVVVLSHDPATPAGSLVTETSSAQLATEGLATLAEALPVIEDHALGVDVEIKNLPWEDDYDPRLRLVDATLEVLDEASPTGPVVLSSFNQEAIDRVREQAGDAYATALITPGAGDARELRARVLAAGHDGVVIDHEAVDAETLHTLSTGGLTLWAYTVDDPVTAAVLVADGVSGIVTDVPDEISERLDLLP